MSLLHQGPAGKGRYKTSSSCYEAHHLPSLLFRGYSEAHHLSALCSLGIRSVSICACVIPTLSSSSSVYRSGLSNSPSPPGVPGKQSLRTSGILSLPARRSRSARSLQYRQFYACFRRQDYTCFRRQDYACFRRQFYTCFRRQDYACSRRQFYTWYKQVYTWYKQVYTCCHEEAARAWLLIAVWMYECVEAALEMASSFEMESSPISSCMGV